MKKFITLSKSKIKAGLNCHKALHLTVYQNHLAKYSNQSKKAFSTGIEVGKLARTKFPNGILIQDFKWADKMRTTLSALKTNKAIFEGTFSFNQVPIQVDILEPVDNKQYNLIEVKSGLSAKDEYIEDAAIQYYVLKGLNVEIKDVFIWFVNKQASSELDLFSKENVTESVKSLASKIPNIVSELLKVVEDEKKIPHVGIGSHCVYPYECPFKHVCWANIPQEKSIFQIPNFSDKWQAFKEGIIEVSDPRLSKYNIRPEVINAILTDSMWVNQEAVVNALKSWNFPLSSLDFETFQVSIPRFPNTHPYQQVPFQFSVHILEKDQTLTHYDFLHQTDSDPRESLVKALIEYVPATGTILAYNAKFEAQVCLELAALFPQYSAELQSIVNRLQDPWLLLKDNLYHPAFKSSYSLKSVAPALLGVETDYKNLKIKDGLEAQEAFNKLITEPNILNKIQLNKDLRDYCQADTLNLILLFQFLAKTCNYSI